MGFSLNKAIKRITRQVEAGGRSLVNATISKPAEILGGAAGKVIAPVAQTGALQQITSGAVSGFTGGAGGAASLLGGGAGPGGFSISDLVNSIRGGAPAPESVVQPGAQGRDPATKPAARPAWFWPAIVGAAVSVVGLIVYLITRRK